MRFGRATRFSLPVWAGLALLLFELNGVSAASAETRARTSESFDKNWKFIQDDDLTDDAALTASALKWQTVNLPHTWNAKDAAGLHVTEPYKRGRGWYRLEFATPTQGARHWLEFGAASMVADVWLNGKKLGQHKGGFTAFRFDVTDKLVEGDKNVLLVKTDNSEPKQSDDLTAIIPLAGDFNVSGGLYRHVALISTREPVHFDLGDFGGSGVYATTMSIADGNATVNVRTKLKSDSRRDGTYKVRVSLLDADGTVAESAQRSVSLQAAESAEVDQDLKVVKPRLWQGVEDPYQYKLVAELLTADDTVIDNVVQDFGIRQVRFDPGHGFFLNDKYVRLRGVAIHQDFLGKGWAMTNGDVDESLALVKEIGANAIRLGHYPFNKYVLESVNKMGLVAWAEVPFGIGSTVQPPLQLGVESANCPKDDPTDAFMANAKQQLQELIRQQYNHAAIAMWSVGNEITFLHKECKEPWYDNVTPVLKELHALAKREDPHRVTTVADFTEKAEPPQNGSYIEVAGITDIWAINQYYLWYSGAVSGLGERFDALHLRFPKNPIGMSEYGAGAALTHHTDNLQGGPAEVINTGVPVLYQPEEYAGYVHEQNYGLLLSRPYLWGHFVWAMFDFGSGLRKEGDAEGVNTKGLVTFDRKTRKDPFYFYKANWSTEPVVHITGRRYTDRAYGVADVRIYSNADSVQLSVNGNTVETLVQDQCVLKTCVFKNVRLRQGVNELVVTGSREGRETRDSVKWSLNTQGVNIAAGQLTTGFKSSAGVRFGSDNFFTGGEGDWLVEKGTQGVEDRTAVCHTASPDLFKNFRKGHFSYNIPLADGIYLLNLGFLEPDRGTKVGERIFDVVANGSVKLADFDVIKAAVSYRTASTRTFPVKVSGGYLKLEFIPKQGEAIVSNIMIRKRLSAQNQARGQRSRKRLHTLASGCIPSSDERCPNCPQPGGGSYGYGR
jgi:beta-galactosidase